MMRSFFCIAVFLCALLCAGTVRADYPDYLGGDRNFLFCGGHMGYGRYVDRSSLVVQEYDPPTYRIEVNVVTVADADMGRTDIYNVTTKYFLYQWDERKVYVLSGGAWQYIPPVGSMADTGHEFSYETAFYLAYHMKFYGGRTWRDPRTGRYETVNFSDHLYDVVDGAN